MIYFKQYGAMRTGTNYIRYLLAKNFSDIHIFMNIGGWKHGPHINKIQNKIILNNTVDYKTRKEWIIKQEILFNIFATNNIIYIVSIKDPYAWVVSFAKFRNKMHKITNPTFIKMIIKKYWNSAYRSYLKYIDDQYWLFIKYEDLINNHEKVLDIIKNKFSLKKKYNKYLNTTYKLAPNTDFNLFNTTQKTIDIDYYIKKKYLEELPKHIIKLINKYILPETFTKFGYTMIN